MEYSRRPSGARPEPPAKGWPFSSGRPADRHEGTQSGNSWRTARDMVSSDLPRREPQSALQRRAVGRFAAWLVVTSTMEHTAITEHTVDGGNTRQ